MAKEIPLNQILLEHINATSGWITKGSLYTVGEKECFSPEYVGRELRTLAERTPTHEPEINVDYYKSKRNIELARYSRLGEPKPIPPNVKWHYEERNGNRVAIYS